MAAAWRFDALGELELHQGPGQVVLPVAGLEVDVTGQVIGEKPQPQLEGQEADGCRTGKRSRLRLRNPRAQGEVAREDGPAQVGLEPHLFPGPGFLPQGVAAGAQAVADVVMHEARLDGVEVHQGHGLAGVGVQHDVVDLGVAVRRSQLELPLGPGMLQNRGQSPAKGPGGKLPANTPLRGLGRGPLAGAAGSRHNAPGSPG